MSDTRGSEPIFEVTDLHASATDGVEILRGVDLVVHPGEIHALMGPNGSGKSTLASVLLGSPEYEVTSGSVRFRGDEITDWSPDVRGKAGIFLAFQYPLEIAGVSVINFLRQALSARKGLDLSVLELRLSIMDWMDRLGMDPSFADRYVNEGFSGGEKKRNEALQLGVLGPRYAVLDEIDSGLDVDALATVSRRIQEATDEDGLGVLAITHFARLLEVLEPDRIHVLSRGTIRVTGGHELAEQLEAEGYAGVLGDAATEESETRVGLPHAAGFGEDPFA